MQVTPRISIPPCIFYCIISEARQNFAVILEEAERDGSVEIRRRDGTVFLLQPAKRSKSPLDVPGVKLGVSTKDLVTLVRKGRER